MFMSCKCKCNSILFLLLFILTCMLIPAIFLLLIYISSTIVNKSIIQLRDIYIEHYIKHSLLSNTKAHLQITIN